jgi:hypothetical protein
LKPAPRGPTRSNGCGLCQRRMGLQDRSAGPPSRTNRAV